MDESVRKRKGHSASDYDALYAADVKRAKAKAERLKGKKRPGDIVLDDSAPVRKLPKLGPILQARFGSPCPSAPS